MRSVLTSMVLLVVFMVCGAVDAAERPPNFVIIFADDLGYGDLSCYGAPLIKTKHLDQMAAEGLRFTSFYCASPICTPSRYGLLTGRYPVRGGFHHVLFPFSKTGIDAEEVTLAEALQDAGYATGCFGKWHLGHLPDYLPTEHGFDYYYGVPYSNDMDVKRSRGRPADPLLPLMRNTEIIEQPADQSTLTKRYTEEAVAFIEQHQAEPFFVYVPHSMPHIPIFASQDFTGHSEQGLYGDVIEEIDWSVGQILDTLRDLDLADNTVVLFSSDNGPWLQFFDHGGSAGPLYGGKGTAFEGGMRVPGIVWWPETIAAGREDSSVVATVDMLPTFLKLAGVDLPDRTLDGHDVSGVLLNTGQQRADQEYHYFHLDELKGFRSGKWKIKIPFKDTLYLGDPQYLNGEKKEHGWLLFELEADPGERHDLSAEYPDILAELQAAREAFLAGMGELPERKS